MEGGKTVSVGAVYVPNSYRIYLGPDDFARFGGLVPTLRNEFSGLLRRTALERRWQFPGPLIVAFEQDPRIPSGRFEVSAEHDAGVVPPPDTGPRDALFLLGSQPPRHWVLAGQRLVVGRLANCDIALNDQNASRQHAELVKRDDGWWIVDLDSTNGTFVNGNLVKERRVTTGDRLQIGSTRLELGLEEPAPPKKPLPQKPPEPPIERPTEFWPAPEPPGPPRGHEDRSPAPGQPRSPAPAGDRNAVPGEVSGTEGAPVRHVSPEDLPQPVPLWDPEESNP